MRLDATGLAGPRLDREIRNTQVQFNKQGALYAPNTYGIDAATKISGTLEATHTQAKSLLHLEMVNNGSGLATGPARAGYTLSVTAFKEGYPSLSAAEGEIDTALFTYRQVNGDACAWLANCGIIEGFGAVYEATMQSIDPGTFAVKHSIQIHAGTVNDRDGGEYGYDAAKTGGEGGTAFYGYSSAGAGWDYGLRLNHKGKAQLQQRTSDAGLIVFEYDTPANYAVLKVVSGVPRFVKPDGNVVDITAPSATITPYTPVFNASSGTLGTVTVTGGYIEDRDGRHIDFWGTATIDSGTGSGQLEMTLPVAAVTETGYAAQPLGRNASTGAPIFGTIPSGGTKAFWRLVNNAYPLSGSGVVITFAGRYRKA